MPHPHGERWCPGQVGRHFLRTVSARSRLVRGAAGNLVSALHGERWLLIHVNVWVRFVVVSWPRSCCQVFVGRPDFHAAGHGVAGAGGLVGSM